ncbi:MAG: shikimate kinase [Gallionellaceae bacterium]|nr:shikimate kinase [Gallionellaceae bacterium]
MIPSDNLFLIGLMGAGKTTIGRMLARHKDMQFLDSDHEIEARCGVSIPTIFEIEGEEGFRRREVCMIDELTRRHGIVLGTGGGAVLNPLNRERLKARGVVIYLRCQPQELYQRTRHDRNRPLLQTEDPLARLQALYEQRHPLYMQTADIVLDTGRQSVHCLVRKLEGVLDLSGGEPAAGRVEEALDASCADLALDQIGERQPRP